MYYIARDLTSILAATGDTSVNLDRATESSGPCNIYYSAYQRRNIRSYLIDIKGEVRKAMPGQATASAAQCSAPTATNK